MVVGIWQSGVAKSLAAAAAIAATIVSTGCPGDPSPPASATSTNDASSGGATSDGSSDSAADSAGSESTGAPPPPTACATETDISAAPQTIAEAIDLINALPHPVTLDCFLEKLERPMLLNATSSTVSLQPADNKRSPRIFMFYGDLIMSVAVDGVPGNRLLEFGEFVAPTKTIKGEIEFPIEDTLPVIAPMERVFDGEGSECRICHGGESPADEYEMAFASDALRFRDIEVVELDELVAEWMACNANLEPDRCRRLDALLAFGVVEPGDFPEGLQTIYDYE